MVYWRPTLPEERQDNYYKLPGGLITYYIIFRTGKDGLLETYSPRGETRQLL